MRFLCMMVIYNTNYKDSETFKPLSKTQAFFHGDISLLVLDNSTKDMHNEEIENIEHCHYLSMHGNKGLSQAYNAGLDYYVNELENNCIVLLDDDTRLSSDYFDKMSKAYTTDVDIYLPIIYDQNLNLLSPSIMNKYRCVLASSLDDINDENINGINTGMMIRGEIFEDYRYDTGYFLDYVDHAFIRDMKKKHKKIVKVNTTLHQSYSLEGDHFASAMKRFEISKKDIYHYYDNGFVSKLVYCYIIVRRKAKYFKQYKRISVFFK